MSPELKKWFNKNKVDLWKGLPFWKTGEWQAAKERLKDLSKAKVGWNPGYDRLFRSMDLCSLENTKVVILGQDPYPGPGQATGLAFDIGNAKSTVPPSMLNIMKELKQDLGIEHNGNLEGWAKQGVLLWNVVPSCRWGKSLSHEWPEWEPLTCDVIKALNKKHIVFVLVGTYVKRFSDTIDHEENEVLYVGHPSPRNLSSPFVGSRIFSNINTNLRDLGYQEIDWSL